MAEGSLLCEPTPKNMILTVRIALVTMNHFEVLRVLGKGAFGKVRRSGEEHWKAPRRKKMATPGLCQKKSLFAPTVSGYGVRPPTHSSAVPPFIPVA